MNELLILLITYIIFIFLWALGFYIGKRRFDNEKREVEEWFHKMDYERRKRKAEEDEWYQKVKEKYAIIQKRKKYQEWYEKMRKEWDSENAKNQEYTKR